MEIDTGGLGAGRRAGAETGSTDLTQYDRLQGAVARLMLDQEAMHASQTSTAMALEDLGKQLHESQRQHHIDIQELHEGHNREMMELRTQQEQMVRTEISTAFQQMSLRAEFHQRLLHLESVLRDTHSKYDTAWDAHQQAVIDLSLLGATKPKEHAAVQKEVDKLGRTLLKQETALDMARNDYEQYAKSGGVDPVPLLGRYVRQ